MLKKLKALRHAIAAVFIMAIVVVLFSVAVPIMIGLTLIAFMTLVGYAVYEANKD